MSLKYLLKQELNYMKKKWKTLLISIVIYQIVLTLIFLKMSHYSLWIHFNGSQGNFPMHWYEGPRTIPMIKSLLWLGVVFFALLIWNVIEFKKNRN